MLASASSPATDRPKLRLRRLQEAESSALGHRLVATFGLVSLVALVSATGLAACLDPLAADSSPDQTYQALNLPAQPLVTAPPTAAAVSSGTVQPLMEAEAVPVSSGASASPIVRTRPTRPHADGAAGPAAGSLAKSPPLRVTLRRLAIDAPVMAVGRDGSGAIEVPPLGSSNLAGWYVHGPTPGEPGPAVLVGHKDTRAGPSVFARLSSARRGDLVEVRRRDHTTAIFTVTDIEQASKARFPTARVYGRTGQARLRLITCGGSFSRATGHYRDNIIVYAVLSGTRP